jgi:hypothetical protein
MFPFLILQPKYHCLQEALPDHKARTYDILSVFLQSLTVPYYSSYPLPCKYLIFAMEDTECVYLTLYPSCLAQHLAHGEGSKIFGN